MGRGSARLVALKIHPNVAEAIVGALLDVFKQGQYSDKVIERTLKAHTKWGSRDRRFVAESVYDLVRWWRSYWHLTGFDDAEYMNPDKLSARRVWRVWGVYQWRQTGKIPDLRECQDIDLKEIGHRLGAKTKPAIRASVPDWLYDACAAELGESWPPLIEALNEQADVFLRANTLKTTAAQLRTKIAEEGILAEPVEGLPDALRLNERKNVFTAKAFRDGLFEVQDGASQHVAPFLEVAPGMRVVDACAGAGGKTLHLAALMRNKGTIIALDIHKWRLDELRRRATRNAADNIKVQLIDDPKVIKRLHDTADRVLLDVPCSGLGVIRRNPDTKWKLKPAELDRLHATQADLLHRYSRITKPGGKLVYATCSILPSENDRQVRSFLEENAETWILEAELTLRPDREGFDGFYAARLQRVK
jgi:16S rRNA (cytosine967-C5)-methyltransferase